MKNFQKQLFSKKKKKRNKNFNTIIHSLKETSEKKEIQEKEKINLIQPIRLEYSIEANEY